MKAIIANEKGGPEALKLQEINEPEPIQGEVKIRILAFGLNKAEMYNLRGDHGVFSGTYALGIEGAGEVIHDPSGQFKKGQKVITAMGGMMFSRHGSYAPVICVRSSNLQVINSDISYEQLATLPQAYLTAWGAIDHALKLQKNETLLVRGGTSTIGLASIVYAKTKGANVIATTRNENHKHRLIEMGADFAVLDDGNIAETLASSSFPKIDKAIELVGVNTLRDTMKSLCRWGEVVFIGFLSGKPVIEQFHLMNDLPNTIKLSFFGSGMLGSDELVLENSPLPEIANLLYKGDIPNIHARTFPATEIQAAHQLMAENTALGKIIITH